MSTYRLVVRALGLFPSGVASNPATFKFKARHIKKYYKTNLVRSELPSVNFPILRVTGGVL